MQRNDLGSRMDEVARRLAEEFAETHDAATVARCVAEARARYADANIQAYLPMFVARRARELLRSIPSALPVG